MKEKQQKLSQAFQQRLLILVVIAFLATTVFLWFFQTRLAEENAVRLLELNISDVRQDIADASDENLVDLAWEIAAELDRSPVITDGLLLGLAVEYGVSEINYIDSDGIIRSSTYPYYLNYDMRVGQQSAEFMVLLSGQESFVQSYQPTTYNSSVSRKYGGVVLEKGGFVQIGYDAERFQQDIDGFVVGVTRNRHVGESGSIIIADERGKIVSDRHGGEGKDLSTTGVVIDTDLVAPGQPFTAQVYGENCYCIYQAQEGYRIMAVIPQREAALSRNVSVGVTTVMEIVVFAVLFFMIYYLVKKLVVDNIRRINGSLSQITGGELETVVDVRAYREFASLSDDINSTVDTLKRYIADAAARIDTELAFAKAIQHSALPSVFPPYPNRKEFEIWADMVTAKEVGGDFYDFYFVDEDTLAFLVADVSGKGIPAAMFMMTAKTLLKSYAESGMSVEEVLIHANEKLCEGNDAGMFVTTWMGYLDTKTGRVTYANAGHNPPVLRRKDGTAEFLRSRPGLVLAGMEGIRYRRYELQLEPGDVLYLYTDGVTEATDAHDELYGEERLMTVLRENAPAGTLCTRVKADVDAFVGEAPQFDDMTMLTLAYHGGETRQKENA